MGAVQFRKITGCLYEQKQIKSENAEADHAPQAVFYTFVMAILLLALLVTLLSLLGRFRTPKDELFEKSDMQAQVFEKKY